MKWKFRSLVQTLLKTNHDLSCFCTSCKKKHWLPWFYTILFRMNIGKTTLKDKDSESHQTKRQVYPLFNVINIMSPSGAKSEKLLSVIKDPCFQNLRFFSYNTTHCIFRCCLPLLFSPSVNWDSGNQYECWHSGYCSCCT